MRPPKPKKPNILIVEDDGIVAKDLKLMLEDSGYVVASIVDTRRKAIKRIRTMDIDLVLIDIHLKEPLDGLELAKTIEEHYHLPFIYVTSHDDRDMLNRVQSTHPYGYIVKPFPPNTLRATVAIALENHKLVTKQREEAEASSLLVQFDYHYERIPYYDILWFSAKGNYTEVHLKDGRNIQTRRGIAMVSHSVPCPPFCQIHRSYIVNLNHIDSYSIDGVKLGKVTLPVGKNHRRNVLDLLARLAP